MPKRIAFYNTYEPVVSLFRDLPMRLSEQGWDVTLVISRAEYRKKGVTLEQHFAGTNVRVKRVGLPWPGEVSKRIPKTLVMLSYCIAACFQILFSKTDLRVFLTQPPCFSNIGRFKKRFSKQEYVCVLMDLYPEVIFANNLMKEGSFLGKRLSKLAKGSRASAGKLVTIGRDMTGYLVETGIVADKLAYIPNWAGVETPAMVPHESNSLRAEWGYTKDDFLVIYSGNMGVSHHFDELLGAAMEFKDHDRIKFVFIGEGPRKKEVREFQDKYNLPNVRIMGYQPMSRLIESLSSADVHFISLKDGFGGLVVPSKVFGVLSVGRPIIFQGATESEISKMLVDHECGVQVDIGDQSNVSAQIQSYANDQEKAQANGERAWYAYNSQYSSSVGIGRYVELIEDLTAGRH